MAAVDKAQPQPRLIHLTVTPTRWSRKVTTVFLTVAPDRRFRAPMSLADRARWPVIDLEHHHRALIQVPGLLPASRAHDVVRHHLSCLAAEPQSRQSGRVAIQMASPSGSCSQNSSSVTRASNPSTTAWPFGPMAGSDC